jgi:hypothetical protein
MNARTTSGWNPARSAVRYPLQGMTGFDCYLEIMQGDRYGSI